MADSSMMFQNNIQVLLLELLRDKGQVDVFPDELLFVWGQLLPAFCEIFIYIAADRGNILLSDLSSTAVFEVLCESNLLIAGELKWFPSCVDNWDVDQPVLVMRDHGGASC